MLHPKQAKPVLSILLWVIVLQGDCQIFTIDKPIANYGDDLTLFCKVDNCCRTTPGWEKWIPELKPIIFDISVVNFTASSKYAGIVSQSGYTLTIRNLTKDDINIGYSCLYGFKRSAIKLLTAYDVFLGPNLTIVRKISSYGQDLELYCEIGNCCNKTSEWEIWEPLLRTISQYIKDQNLSAISKYAVTSSYNGYSLVIRNVSVDDLNKTYSCLYGFTRSNKLVLLKNDVFKKYMSVEDNDGDNNNVLITSVAIAVAVVAVFGITTLVVFLMARRRKGNKKEKTLEETELLHTDQTEVQNVAGSMTEDIPENNDAILDFREQNRRCIKEWENEDTTFVNTRAADKVIELIKSSNCVVVTGSSGTDTELLPTSQMDHAVDTMFADTDQTYVKEVAGSMTEKAEEPLMIHSDNPEDNDSIHYQTIPSIRVNDIDIETVREPMEDANIHINIRDCCRPLQLTVNMCKMFLFTMVMFEQPKIAC